MEFNVEALRVAIAETLDKIESIDQLGPIAAKVEAALGAWEHQGLAPDELDEEWNFFCDSVFELVDGDEDATITPNEAEAGLRDNYFHIAMRCISFPDQVENHPLIAWAAFNKNQYRGFSDEIATVRLLISSGFNPNIPDGKNTPLHYMASWQHNPGSSPRGVRLLLKAGAKPNVQNQNGDTPLGYLAGNLDWNEYTHASAIHLLNAGADPFIQANDGATALSLLEENQEQQPNDIRQALIEKIRMMVG